MQNAGSLDSLICNPSKIQNWLFSRENWLEATPLEMHYLPDGKLIIGSRETGKYVSFRERRLEFSDSVEDASPFVLETVVDNEIRLKLASPSEHYLSIDGRSLSLKKKSGGADQIFVREFL